MTHYVYSTLPSDHIYCEWITGKNDLPTMGKRVVIKGGAGVSLKHTTHFETLNAVITPVSDAELEILMQNKVFQKHLESKAVRVEAKKVSVDKALNSLQARDASAPLDDEQLAKFTSARVSA